MIDDEVRRKGSVEKPCFDPDDDSNQPASCLRDIQEEIDFLIHEIRTPLTAVAGSAQYLQENDLCEQERSHWLAAIRSEALRINSLLDDFTRLNASGAWLSSIHLSTVEIRDLLLEIVEVFQDSCPKHILRVEVPPELESVCGDRKKLAMVLRNLVANAVKYSPHGGTVLIFAERRQGQVVIGVRDEGLGIPREKQEAIFESSFRVYRPDGMRMRGTGLGLTLVRRVVENHGGQVWVESAPGRGSTFSFSLPEGEKSRRL